MNRYYEELQTRLKKRRSDGWTNQRMAELAETSQTHINRLLNGDAEQFAKVAFGTLLRLFPSFFAPCLEPRTGTPLTADEIKLILDYRASSPEGRELVRGLAANAAASARGEKSSVG